MIQLSANYSHNYRTHLRNSLLAELDLLRLSIGQKLSSEAKKQKGQFLTSSAMAELMAKMFTNFNYSHIYLLDAGAGIGSLSVAFVTRICQLAERPIYLKIIAYEIEPIFLEQLPQVFQWCQAECELVNIIFDYEIHATDFVASAVQQLQCNLFNQSSYIPFTHAILNPPYFKINTQSPERLFLRSIGLETSNIYPGFITLAMQLLASSGELVTITPRSFCNGLYFREFRKIFLEQMVLRQFHLFTSRYEPFQDDHVLQETMIVHSIKQKNQQSTITIDTSDGLEDDWIMSHTLPYEEVVNINDPEKFIRILPDSFSQNIVRQIQYFTCTLEDLELSVSTGKVVDFRCKNYLRTELDETIEPETVPLIYPIHCSLGYVKYPTVTKKHQAILKTEATANLLIPNGNYVLTKRFSPKEEKKIVVASICQGDRCNSQWIGLENHINYFHQNGQGLPLNLAKGLAIYLNSTLVDCFLRLFTGSTQVNATDLRNLKYPSLEQLIWLGSQIDDVFPEQSQIEQLIQIGLLHMAEPQENNPLQIKLRIDEALDILAQLEFTKGQRNERSALTLLALINLLPDQSWSSITSPLIGITPIMDFMRQYYGKNYKPNTRESVRRQTIHQFLDVALIVVNPDNPSRPINSPKTVYQIETRALELLKTYGTPAWESTLKAYLSVVKNLKDRYSQARETSRIPILIDGKPITLSPGGQNILIEKIVREFLPRFTPGGKLIYVGDTEKKFAHFNELVFTQLGIKIDPHGKMPDLVIHFTTNNWLVLIEAVTSHGPINTQRQRELKTLFKDAKIPLVMVTAFPSRQIMVRYLTEIAWETDVWIAEDVSHLIHFNGQNLLQLYSNCQDI